MMLLTLCFLLNANPYTQSDPPILLVENGLDTERTNTFAKIEDIDQSNKIKLKATILAHIFNLLIVMSQNNLHTDNITLMAE